MLKLVLFDIDGTLIQSGGAGVKAFARAFADEFNVRDGVETMQFAGRTDTGLAREIFQRHGIAQTAENFDRFFARYIHWLAHNLHQLNGRICRGADDFLRQFEAMPNLPTLGLLTGNIRLGAEVKLRHFNLWKPFVTGAFADDHHNRNEIAVMAKLRGEVLAGRKIEGDEILVIGDTPLDIECGRAIGAKVLAVATGQHSVTDLAAHRPDWALPDLVGRSVNDFA